MEKKPKPKKIANADRIQTRESAQARYEERLKSEGQERVAELEDPVEAKIQQAMAEGAFDNLPGKGKPLNIGKYMEVPEHLRTAYHVLRNAGYLPEEVRLKREMEELKHKIKQCRSKTDKKMLVKELADVSQQYYFYMDYNKQFKK
jgi:hypothetical protein